MTSPQRTPASRHNWGRLCAAATILVLGGSLAACGPQNSAQTPTTTQPTSASPSTSAPAPTTDVTPSSMPAPETSADPTNVASPLCPAASLEGALDDSGGGAAGHIYMKLTVTNTSGADCILDGYPGVSMVAAGSTTPIGAPAERDPQAPSNGPITLAPGDSADATLRYTQAGNYQDCQREQAAAILVYPPSATDSLEIPHPLTACSNDAIKLLTIGAFAQ